jgi:cytochrome P450
MQTLDQLIDLTNPDFRLTDRHAAYARLRREAPVHWNEKGRCWVLSTYEDIRYVSLNPDRYSSEKGILVIDGLYPEAHAARTPPGGENLLGTDPPRHQQLRKLVSHGFTPKSLRDLEAAVRRIIVEILDRVEPGKEFDFVTEVAVPIPIRAIVELLSLQSAELDDVKRWSDSMFATADVVPGTPAWEGIEADLFEAWIFFSGLLAERREEPTDDLLSRLMAAEIDGEKLDDATTVMFGISLMAAGNHTSRSMLAGGVQALAETPNAYAKLRANPDLVPNAVSEMLRWTAPFASMCRTATRDDEIGGVKIRGGDYVVLLYESANRDESVWPDGEIFDVARSTTPAHLSFGWGEHVCIGSHLARMEAQLLLEEMLPRFGEIQVCGEPELIPSIGVNCLRRLPVAFHN